MAGQTHGRSPVDIPSSASYNASNGSSSATDESPPLAPLLRLPPELLSVILSHVPPQQYQRTALALHKVFPDHGLAEEHLWRHISVRRGEQLMPLWKAARARRDRVKGLMDDQEAEMRAWKRNTRMRGGEGEEGDDDEEDEEEEEEEDEDARRLRLGKKMGTASFAMESWRGDADLLNK